MIFNLSNLGAFSFASIGSILIAVLILLFMVTIHEAGHYFAGKIFGFKINEFAIGMGPAIFKKKLKNGEDFSIRILPLGGFCAFEGEDKEVSGESDPSAFNNKKPWQRIIVLLAGATMNFIAAVLIFMLSIGIYGQSSFQAFETLPNNGVYALQSGDTIEKIDGKNIYIATDIITALKGKKANDIVGVTVLRGGEIKDGRIFADKKIRKTVQVRLICDPTSENLQDYSNVFKSLGIATIFGITDSSESDFTKLITGDYFLRITNVKPELFDQSVLDNDKYTDCVVFEERIKKHYAIDNEKYLNEKRLFTLDDFRAELKKYNEGDTVYFYASRAVNETDSERVLLEYKLVGFNDEVKASNENIDKYFGINSVAASYRLTTLGVRYGFFESIGRGFVNSFKSAGTTFSALGQLITGKLGLDAIGGPITTISITSQYVSYGFEYVLQIAGLIGVSLAAFNILPIPALDGARAVFVLIEWIRRKPIDRKVEGTIHTVGLIVLLAFTVLIDLVKCF